MTGGIIPFHGLRVLVCDIISIVIDLQMLIVRKSYYTFSESNICKVTMSENCGDASLLFYISVGREVPGEV